MLLIVLATACSKKKDTPEPEVNPEAIVQTWIQPMNYSTISGRPIYFYTHTDPRITQEIIEKGKVLVYLFRLNYNADKKEYFKMDYQDGTKTFVSTLKKSEITLTANFNPYDSPLAFAFCYILLPEGYKIPTGLDLSNFDSISRHFNITKDLIFQL